MKKIILLTLLCLSAINLFAKRNFNCDIAMSVQDDSMDWWYFLPENSTPFVQDLKTCYRQEKLNFHLFFKFFDEMKENSFEYEFFVIGKDKMEDIALERTKFSFDDDKINSILPLGKPVEYHFGYDAPLGKYDILLRVIFEKEVFDFVKSIDLIEWEFPSPIKSQKYATNFIFNYSQLASPKELFALFISDTTPLLKNGAPKGLDYFFLSFYKYAFDAQPFLYSKLLQLYPSANETLQKRILILFAYANKAFNSAVFMDKDDKAVYEYLSQNIIPEPYKELKGSFAPAQLDILWGEFYATSSFKAFIKIISTLEYTKEGAYAEKLVREGALPLSPQEKADFAVGMTYLNTLKRIILSTENPLFLKYLYKAIESKKLSSAVSIQLAVLVKTANENAKPEKEPQIIEIGKLNK